MGGMGAPPMLSFADYLARAQANGPSSGRNVEITEVTDEQLELDS